MRRKRDPKQDDEAYLDFLDSIYIDPQGTMEETRVLGREIIESCGVRLHYIRFAFAWKIWKLNGVNHIFSTAPISVPCGVTVTDKHRRNHISRGMLNTVTKSKQYKVCSFKQNQYDYLRRSLLYRFCKRGKLLKFVNFYIACVIMYYILRARRLCNQWNVRARGLIF